MILTRKDIPVFKEMFKSILEHENIVEAIVNYLVSEGDYFSLYYKKEKEELFEVLKIDIPKYRKYRLLYSYSEQTKDDIPVVLKFISNHNNNVIAELKEKAPAWINELIDKAIEIDEKEWSKVLERNLFKALPTEVTEKYNEILNLLETSPTNRIYLGSGEENLKLTMVTAIVDTFIRPTKYDENCTEILTNFLNEVGNFAKTKFDTDKEWIEKSKELEELHRACYWMNVRRKKRELEGQE